MIYGFNAPNSFGFNSKQGFGYISAPLAAILYQTSLGDFVYSTDANGNAILDNQGSLGATNDGLLNTGRALELGATNDLAIPIHNTGGTGSFLTYYDFTQGKFITLGNSVDGGSSEELITNGGFDTDTDWTKGTGWSISGGFASIGAVSFAPISQNALTIGRRVVVELSARGSQNIRIFFGTGAFQDVAITSEWATYSVTGVVTSTTDLLIYNINNQAVDIDNVSVKEILPISTTYTLNNQTVNSILKDKTAWDASDWAKIQANPQLVAKLALSPTGSIPELNKTLDADDAWYPCSEEA